MPSPDAPPLTAEAGLARLVYTLGSFRRFLAHVKTITREGAVLPYPLGLPFVEEMIDALETERQMLWLKSRRMLVTWTAAAWTLYLTIKHPHFPALLLSKDREASEELKGRTDFIYDGLPAWLRRPMHRTRTMRLTVFDNGSKILALPASPGNARGLAAGFAFMDEAAHFMHGPAVWVGLRPTLEARGQVLLATTPSPKDRLFIRQWKSDPCPFAKLELHWRSFPGRDDVWAREARIGMTEQEWRQEMELDLHAFSGLVFTQFSDLNIIDPIELPSWWTRVVGLDYGAGSNYGAAWEARAPNGDRFIFDEQVGANVPLGWNVRETKARSAGLPIAAFVIDPRATGRNMSSLLRYVDEVRRALNPPADQARGLPTLPLLEGNPNLRVGFSRMNEWLRDRETKRPRVFIFRTCPNILDAFRRLTGEQVARGEIPHILEAYQYAFMHETPVAVQPPRFSPNEMRALPLPDWLQPKNSPWLTPLDRMIHHGRYLAQYRPEEDRDPLVMLPGEVEENVEVGMW